MLTLKTFTINTMRRTIPWISALLLMVAALPTTAGSLPDGFAYVGTTVPDATLEVRYYTNNNFIGERIDGYLAPRIILSVPAATALAKVQTDLKPFGLTLKVFDGYRPQRAVDHFVRWGKDLDDTRMKAEYYPKEDKKDLFRNGYIAKRSGHSRGSTVDLTIVDIKTGKELNMGTPFDFFSPKSWPKDETMTGQVRTNRALLRVVMARYGFNPYEAEWWHFTLKNEPYPETYFDFPVQ